MSILLRSTSPASIWILSFAQFVAGRVKWSMEPKKQSTR